MSEPPVAYNYCVCFIDLLGQRRALSGEGLLPVFTSNEQRQAFSATVRNSIGAIIGLQKQAETMVGRIAEPRESEFRAKLPKEHQAIWDEMQKTRVTTQRWSDGLVSFVSLGNREVKCLMNGVYSLFSLAGSLCLLGLALHRPIRGAIDAAWGIELHPGELYGAAVARAYELESEVAQYPRIVVDPRAIGFLEVNRANQSQDVFAQYNRALAELCLAMLLQDADGRWLIHYLGEEFKRSISQSQHAELYQKAVEFVAEQFEQHRANGDTKLAFRYSHLLQYFLAHPLPGVDDSGAQPGAAGGAPQAARP